MEITITRTIPVTLGIYNDTSGEEEPRERLAVYVGDWRWAGPFTTIDDAHKARQRTETALRDALASYTGSPRPYDTHGIAVHQASIIGRVFRPVSLADPSKFLVEDPAGN